MVFDAQLVSVKEYRVAGGGPPRLELLPLTQRYAALTTSLLLLNADYEVSSPMCNNPRILKVSQSSRAYRNRHMCRPIKPLNRPWT